MSYQLLHSSPCLFQIKLGFINRFWRKCFINHQFVHTENDLESMEHRQQDVMIDMSMVYCWLNLRHQQKQSQVLRHLCLHSPVCFWLLFLAALTIISWVPPKCGATEGLNGHWTALFAVFYLISSWSSWFTKSFDFFSAFTKLPSLYEHITLGIPLRLAILENALKNESVSILNDISKCIARVFRQVNKHKYHFALLILLPCIVMNGPA